MFYPGSHMKDSEQKKKKKKMAPYRTNTETLLSCWHF